ncbi:hypothetical protein A3F62_05070 [Candidatus Woesebacteria bacterium RIFCSPHIGHO2_12_FULL_44_11]|nr:MAG: hypothetical protein A3F62_05070 [Candidatus Woesebacteria bacterium RIFCSPHIGHO2_12_FULL_44_11]
MSAERVNPPTLYLLQYPDCRNLQIDCALEGCVRFVFGAREPYFVLTVQGITSSTNSANYEGLFEYGLKTAQTKTAGVQEDGLRQE